MPEGMSSNRIERSLGSGGFPCLTLSHSSGYSVIVSEYGAQVLSWRAPSERELLFVSEAAHFQSGKAIRGGIPLVFPQFGKGQLPQHGFARTALWKVVREQVSTNGSVSVTLRLASDARTLVLWPHAFLAELDVVLTDVLLMTLRVENPGSTAFQFTSALHTYFRVGDSAQVQLQGLQEIEYIDLLNQRKMAVEQRADVRVAGPVDRVYRDSPQILTLVSESDGVRFSITKEGFSDTVLWNPWIENSKTDLGATEYQQMVCVESGNIVTPISVQPGETHTSAQIIRAEEGLLYAA
jgi:glucose-6-phosphate 1-epimerase